MKFYYLFLILFSFLFVSCGDDNSSTGPTAPSDNTLLPLALGNEWNYDVTVIDEGDTTYSSYKMILEEEHTFLFNYADVTAFKSNMYFDGIKQESVWLFTYNNVLYGSSSADDEDVWEIQPKKLSIKEASKIGEISNKGRKIKVGVVKLKIMSKERDCIKYFVKDDENRYSFTYFVPGIGMVQEEFGGKEFDNTFSRTAVLKSYILR